MTAKTFGRSLPTRGLSFEGVKVTASTNTSNSEKMCICCLVSNETLINLNNCKHLSILRYLIIHSNKLVCKNCHSLIIKFSSFIEQIKENIASMGKQTPNLSNKKKVLDLKRSHTEFTTFNCHDKKDLDNKLCDNNYMVQHKMKVDVLKDELDDGETTDEAEFDITVMKRDPAKRKSVSNDLNALEPFSKIINDDIDLIPLFKVKKKCSDINDGCIAKDKVSRTVDNSFKYKVKVTEVHQTNTIDPLLPAPEINVDKALVNNVMANVDDDKEFDDTEQLEQISTDKNLDIETNTKVVNEVKEKRAQEILDEERRRHLEEMASLRHASLDADEYKGKIRLLHLTMKEALEEMRQQRLSTPYIVMAHKCELCAVGFDRPEGLKLHTKRRHYKAMYVCDICKRSAKSRLILEGHYKLHYTRYECEVCSAKFPGLRTAVRHYNDSHELIVEPEKYKCDTCGFVTDCATKLKYHRHKERNKTTSYKCEKCPKVCRTPSLLRDHVLVVHEKKELPKIYKCQQCDSLFDKYKQLKNHMKVTHTYPAPYCVECDSHFKSMDSFKAHITKTKKHTTPDQKAICDYCNKTFYSKQYLKTHITGYHLRLLPHKCHICLKSFKISKYLKDHIRLVHEKQKPPRPHVCDTCGKAFTTRNILKAHLRTHTGERPYSCINCPATFNQSGALYTHNKLVHKLRGGRTKLTDIDNSVDDNK